MLARCLLRPGAWGDAAHKELRVLTARRLRKRRSDLLAAAGGGMRTRSTCHSEAAGQRHGLHRRALCEAEACHYYPRNECVPWCGMYSNLIFGSVLCSARVTASPEPRLTYPVVALSTCAPRAPL
ncbi:hypothetical protein E2C01_027552 [Portunus trituberculatus]|uniref:Uncharacterized protein n=1 Tax=Portunus trituberculatus TaxID=210409 RepID=A0A5B7EIE5_PORTR|nr:hypothetical protein [Portunus trituberculatus]